MKKYKTLLLSSLLLPLLMGCDAKGSYKKPKNMVSYDKFIERLEGNFSNYYIFNSDLFGESFTLNATTSESLKTNVKRGGKKAVNYSYKGKLTQNYIINDEDMSYEYKKSCNESINSKTSKKHDLNIIHDSDTEVGMYEEDRFTVTNKKDMKKSIYLPRTEEGKKYKLFVNKADGLLSNNLDNYKLSSVLSHYSFHKNEDDYEFSFYVDNDKTLSVEINEVYEDKYNQPSGDAVNLVTETRKYFYQMVFEKDRVDFYCKTVVEIEASFFYDVSGFYKLDDYFYKDFADFKAGDKVHIKTTEITKENLFLEEKEVKPLKTKDFYISEVNI